MTKLNFGLVKSGISQFTRQTIRSKNIISIISTRCYSSNMINRLGSSNLGLKKSLVNNVNKTFIRNISTEMRQAIDSAVHSAPVVLFMKGTPAEPQCGFSKAAIEILGYQGVDPHKFSAFNVLEDPDLRQGIKEYSDWPTIPQLYVNNEFVGGTDILMSMHQSGELADLLEKAGVLVPEEPEPKEEK